MRPRWGIVALCLFPAVPRARLSGFVWPVDIPEGKEKREESVAYHRQRAALGRLHEKHNLASERASEIGRGRWRALQGARIENALVAREGDETSKAKIRMSVGMLLGCVYRVIQQSREDREKKHAREGTHGGGG